MIQSERIASGFDVELNIGAGWFRTAIDLLIEKKIISVAGLPIIITDVQITFEEDWDLQIDVFGLPDPILARATLNDSGTQLRLEFSNPLVPPRTIPFGALTNLSGKPVLVKRAGDADHEPALVVLANLRLHTNDQSDGPFTQAELVDQLRGDPDNAVSMLPKGQHIAFGMGKDTYKRFANNIWHTELRASDGTHPLPDSTDRKGDWKKVSMKGNGKIVIKLEGEVPIDLWPDADVTITLTLTPTIVNEKFTFTITSDTNVDTGILGDIFAFFAGGLAGGLVGFLIGLLTGGILAAVLVGAAIGAAVGVIALEIGEVVVEGIVQKQINAKINGEPVASLHCNELGIVQLATPQSDGFDLAVLDSIPSSIAIHTDTTQAEPLYKRTLLVTSKYDEIVVDSNGFAVAGQSGVHERFQPMIASLTAVTYAGNELQSLTFRTMNGSQQTLTKAEVLARAAAGELRPPFKLFTKPEDATLRIPEGKLACVCLRPVAIKQMTSIVEEIEFENGVRLKVPDAIMLQDAGALIVQGYQLIHPREYKSYYRAKADFFKDNNFESLPKITA
ncbi:MAG TPA: hypothetical protein VFH43_00435 [Candidatus Kapabacteria bacterium]|nr:hypothetical protein [Candidatus Kapabacteria bacterium]